MALVLRTLRDSYKLYLKECDPRSFGDPLLSPIFIVAIISLYIWVSKDFGPKFMEKRKPYNVKNIILFYNMVQILANAYLFYGSITAISRRSINTWNCMELNLSTTPEGYSELHLAYVYFYLKLLDLFDTIFFIVKKNFRQVTFLHVYHHSAISFGGWLAPTFFPGGHVFWVGVFNCAVHVLMYSYYFLTAYNPEWKKNHRFKRSITEIQLVQFFAYVYFFTAPLLTSECTFPRWATITWLAQSFFMIFLFGDFYLKEYIYKKPVKKT